MGDAAARRGEAVLFMRLPTHCACHSLPTHCSIQLLDCLLTLVDIQSRKKAKMTSSNQELPRTVA